MALTDCFECKRKISNTASFCIHCGARPATNTCNRCKGTGEVGPPSAKTDRIRSMGVGFICDPCGGTGKVVDWTKPLYS